MRMTKSYPDPQLNPGVSSSIHARYSGSMRVRSTIVLSVLGNDSLTGITSERSKRPTRPIAVVETKPTALCIRGRTYCPVHKQC